MTNESTLSSPNRKNEQFVTELAGPNDYWVSVTDAARITRRQEHTIRTWISQGLLPVYPERTGINKRTRRVRMSDLAQLTPIIDQSAAITSEQGKLDLLSIPRQQQEILEAHQQLLAQMEQTNRQLHQYIADLVHQQERLQEAVQQKVATLETEQHWALEALRVDIANKIEMLHRVADLQHRQHEELVALLNGQNQRITQLREELTQERDALTQAVAAHRQENTERLLQLTQRMDELQRRMELRLEEKTRELLQRVETQLDQHARTNEESLQDFHKKVAADMTVFTQQIEQQLELLTTEHEGTTFATGKSPKSIDQQDQEIQALKDQLQEEIQARQKLEEHIAKLIGEHLTTKEQ